MVSGTVLRVPEQAGTSRFSSVENLNPRSNFFDFKFLLLDGLSKILAQLFLVCEHIF